MTGAVDKLPAVFGRYLLLKRLSRGGMGEIFLAKVGEVEGFEKPIVIKTILPDLASDEAFLRLFIEEAKVAIKLNHGNLVPVFEVGLIGEQYFLAMEYVAGQDLRALLTRAREKGHRVAPDVALYLVRELANGLAYAHRRTDEAGNALELVHCDISPPNVLVSYEGEVKIIDFGVARSAMQRARDRENVGFGKFGYMAPEQLVRGAAIDRRADIYSSGVLLYELLTGKRLFNFPPDADYRTVARAVTAGRFPRPSEGDIKLGEQFDNLVMRALHTEPAQRYQSAEELRDAVQQQLYAMSPTISADAPAGLLRSLFGGELAIDQRMLRKISETDVGAFHQAFHHATSKTVTFARAAGTLSIDRLPELGPPPAPSPPAPAGQAGTADPPVGGEGREPGTRPLSRAEQAQVFEYDDSGAPVDDTPAPIGQTGALSTRGGRRTMVVAAASAALLALAVLLLVAFWPEPPGPRPPSLASTGDAAGAGGGLVSAALDAGGQERATAVADGRSPGAAEDAAASALSFAPDPVRRSTRDAGGLKAKARTRPRRVRRGRRRRPAKKIKPRPKVATAPSIATVQRKFIRVRREYSRFARSYGGRFESEWQKILFANTYGHKDEKKYRQLDRLLDDLLRKMSQVRRGGG